MVSDDNDNILEGKFNKIIEENKDSEILFVCDLMGGTPFKVASKLSFTNDSYEVVTGINLGGLIDTSMKLDKMSIRELKISCCLKCYFITSLRFFNKYSPKMFLSNIKSLHK